MYSSLWSSGLDAGRMSTVHTRSGASVIIRIYSLPNLSTNYIFLEQLQTVYANVFQFPVSHQARVGGVSCCIIRRNSVVNNSSVAWKSALDAENNHRSNKYFCLYTFAPISITSNFHCTIPG